MFSKMSPLKYLGWSLLLTGMALPIGAFVVQFLEHLFQAPLWRVFCGIGGLILLFTHLYENWDKISISLSLYWVPLFGKWLNNCKSWIFDKIQYWKDKRDPNSSLNLRMKENEVQIQKTLSGLGETSEETSTQEYQAVQGDTRGEVFQGGATETETALQIRDEIQMAEGVIDLIRMEAVYCDGDKIRREAIPTEYIEEAKAARAGMLASLSKYSDELMEARLEDRDLAPEVLEKIIQEATENKPTPISRSQLISSCLSGNPPTV